MSDTIFAQASPRGKGSITIVRVSGPKASESFQVLADYKKLPQDRKAELRKLVNPVSRETIDKAVVTYYPKPHSYTGEDVVEYSLHGGRAVLNSLFEALMKFDGHRMAEPGEFTRRAFENEKMDLTEAEAVNDLINAETQAQKIQAFQQMEGKLSRLYNSWAETLKNILAHTEAYIDFSDEDLPEQKEAIQKLHLKIAELIEAIRQHLNNNRGERLRDGIHVVVLGAPNAGKSSLVNAMTQRDIAIVSEYEGTTRDIIEAHLDIAGYPVILSDTAGLRPNELGDTSQDKIEAKGIRKALERASNADIRIIMFDASKLPEIDESSLALANNQSILVVNKIDEIDEDVPKFSDQATVNISVKTGKGLDRLIAAILSLVEQLLEGQDQPSPTHERYRTLLESSVSSLERSQKASEPELMAEDIRLGLRDIGRITGRVDVEDLLDVIFKDFCIGK